MKQSVTTVELTSTQESKIMENTADFAAMSIPQSITGSKEQKIRKSVHASFIDAFNKVSHISAMAAWLSALLALIFIRQKS